MFRPTVALCLLVSLLEASPAGAEETCADGSFTPTHRIEAALPPRVATIRPVVTLAPLQAAAPTLTIVLDGIVLPARAGAFARFAQTAILADLRGMPTVFVASSEEPDRHGRLRGILHLENGDGVAERLLAAGAGVADVSFEPCAARFLAVEAKARAEKRGVWRQSRIWTNLNAAATGLPDFVLGRGRVASVGQSGRTTYINFGDNFRTDATVRLREALASALVEAGRPPESLSGRMVEVRGWARWRNGLDLELDTPAALQLSSEVADKGAD
ncbi:thermonuclease family protein [Pleomorphomonas sp. JP5]|uniref:thermonuclease family protein n=1 Tax=Pleomorphomonas sp. JP5 TaxID=2942998 RepID=UPI0020438E0B|nr:hypothetical protein [Pleomorphomonas sp. JP5]MCM5556530.1 hypothetical protein [Pleomorphomonas sp. JP5]